MSAPMRCRARLAALLLAPLVLGACSHAPRTALEPPAPARRAPPVAGAPAAPDAEGPADESPGAEPAPGERTRASWRGKASFYARSFEGRRTANGERYCGQALTAAHLWLPFGTRVRVTNLHNGRSVEVVINDRGPHCKGRIIDLSRRAAEEIGLLRAGVAPVVLEVVTLAAD